MPPDLAHAEGPGGSGGLGWSRRRIPDVVAIMLWIVVAALALVAVLRMVAWDALSPLAILNALTVVLYLPAWPIAVVGALGRRPVLAAAALAVGIAQLVFLAPELTATQPLPAWTAHAPTFTLLDANVYFENPSMSGYVQQIRQVRPDVVTLEECTPNDFAQLQVGGALTGLPYRFEVYGTDPFIFCIASRYPLSNTRVERLGEHPLAVETVLALPSGPQPLWVVHTIAPLSISFTAWRAQLTQIDRLVRARGTDRLLLVGDFNATWNNQGFRQILSSGLVDAAAARGQALTMTWSQTMSPIPPLLRMDHLLTGTGVAVMRLAVDHGPGSDHRDLVATVATR